MVLPVGFDLLLGAAALVAGIVAAFTGFGIGSILTPLLALQVDARLAVAAISIPHFVGTAMRFLMLRGHVDRHVLWSFGLTSAAGGLTGALLQVRVGNATLLVIFGSLLVFVAVSEFSGLAGRMRFRGLGAWLAGAASGLLGGLVGSQGSIRSAALLGLPLQREAFVATATATGLLVDAARMPVYLWAQGGAVAALGPSLVIATVGVVAGTWLGGRLLPFIPHALFRRLVAALVGALGIVMLWRALGM
ncbi:MAG: sulfite exporter TauE/SafE family protein [Acidobacteriota bacterium]